VGSARLASDAIIDVGNGIAGWSPKGYGQAASVRKIKRADERTRTADLLQLRVIHQALQGFARHCKSRISKPVSLLCLAVCCSVLRSQWCQSGVKIAVPLAFTSGDRRI
jgi:hypothetical protein